MPTGPLEPEKLPAGLRRWSSQICGGPAAHAWWVHIQPCRAGATCCSRSEHAATPGSPQWQLAANKSTPLRILSKLKISEFWIAPLLTVPRGAMLVGAADECAGAGGPAAGRRREQVCSQLQGRQRTSPQPTHRKRVSRSHRRQGEAQAAAGSRGR